MKTQRLKTYLHQWTSKITNNSGLGILGRFFNFFKKMDPVKGFIHELNREAFKLNKNIVAETQTMQKVPLNQKIYNEQQPTPQVVPSAPMSNAASAVPKSQAVAVTPQPQYSGLTEVQLNQFMDKMSSMEKKIDRFFNLIEKRVVKNAKEINIRIKLNDLNENTNSEQE
jgi:hypothetical protein